MPSASPATLRALALACCLALLGGVLSGCMTTQETAVLRQARARQILKARELRREQHQRQNHRSRSKNR